MIQSAQMATIYAAAYITIAADAADDCYTGFLRPAERKSGQETAIRCLASGKSSIVRVRWRGALAAPLPYHRQVRSQTVDSQDRCLNYANLQSKLSTRAWAFQERLLSQRTLHFASSELAWECKSKIACECCATTTRKNRITSLTKGSVEKLEWWSMVEDHTKLQLTRQEDRMAAIAGLAQEMAKFSPGDQYVCGLWRSELNEDLLWHVNNSRESSTLRNHYLAPTWSWGSVTGAVTHLEGVVISQTFRILNIDV